MKAMKKASFDMLWRDVVASTQNVDSQSSSKIIQPRANPTVIIRRKFTINYLSQTLQLTWRELQTLDLICMGKTVPQAALELTLSSRTVEFFVKSLRYKFACKSKRDLMDNIAKHNIIIQVRRILEENSIVI